MHCGQDGLESLAIAELGTVPSRKECKSQKLVTAGGVMVSRSVQEGWLACPTRGDAGLTRADVPLGKVPCRDGRSNRV